MSTMVERTYIRQNHVTLQECKKSPDYKPKPEVIHPQPDMPNLKRRRGLDPTDVSGAACFCDM